MATRISIMVAAVLLMIVTASALQPAPSAQRVQPVTRNTSRGEVKVTVEHSGVMFKGFETPFEVTVTSDREITFQYGNDVREVLGVYLLGPWGPIKPKHDDWLNRRHKDSEPITISKDKPWKVQFKLSEFFDVFANPHGRQWEEGKYQVNVKFFADGLDLNQPVDSEPVSFTVGPLAVFRSEQSIRDF